MQPIHDRNPAGAWIAFRTDWSTRLADPASSVNMKEEGAHTPGPTQATVEWLIHERDVLGFAAETINTDAGREGNRCHVLMRGAGRYGLQCLTTSTFFPHRQALHRGTSQIREGRAAPSASSRSPRPEREIYWRSTFPVRMPAERSTCLRS